MGAGKLYVTMFGDFYLEYNGKPLQLPLDIHSIIVQFLVILWEEEDKGLNRDLILSRLYGEADVSNPANSMRVNIFRLRKMIKNLGLPEHEYITSEHGCYRWDPGEIIFETDIHRFKEYLNRARTIPAGEEKNMLLEKACDLYKGDFLPALAAEQWAAVKAINYQNMYVDAVTQLYESFKGRGDYDRAVAIADRALKLYTFENFAIMKIDALMSQGRFQEAMNALDEVGRKMFRDLSVVPSEEMMKRYEALGSHIRTAHTTIKKIKTQLEEEKANGAYFCSFPSFVDCYRILKRISIRSGRTLFLVNCIMTDSRGKRLGKAGKGRDNVPFAMKAIEGALRSGDIYTKSNDTQFLILLSGLTLENCSLVTDRISEKFLNSGAIHGIKLDFHITVAVSEKKT
ncbi:AfsR/SARP family transcriptional regulator [Clostridium transplantifaecale]|uniref:AfsR/SARP family transcriptional regulator n=1 Tax=Clostridium transplantifaecale TaxID=2479838 RepID=UPI000F633FF1|nr:BTAD domain-containing putative transcriptional regulator [Clostridium transplantifaecale]